MNVVSGKANVSVTTAETVLSSINITHDTNGLTVLYDTVVAVIRRYNYAEAYVNTTSVMFVTSPIYNETKTVKV